MGATDRRSEMAGIIALALAERTPGEQYGFDVGPALIHAPQGVAIGYVLIISCRSPVLSPPRIAHTQVIADAWPSDEMLAQAVATCLDELAKRRADLLRIPAQAGNGQAAG